MFKKRKECKKDKKIPKVIDTMFNEIYEIYFTKRKEGVILKPAPIRDKSEFSLDEDQFRRYIASKRLIEIN